MNAIKKHQLTMAVIGATMAMASTAALAQTSVTVFGQIALGLTKATGTSTQVATTGWGNGIGFKGSEDLGGGLSAYFHIENRFDADTGAAATPFWAEKTLVGLSGGFGNVQLGRFGNAFDDTKGMGDPFGETVANIGREELLGETKWDNSIGYSTPGIGGFSGVVTVATKEGANVRSPYAVGLKYGNGPLAAGIGYVKNGLNDSDSFTVSGNYDFGAAKLYAGYTSSSPITTGLNNARNAQIGVGIPVSAAGTVKAAFSNTKLSAAVSSSVNKTGLGYWHNLSKRTMLFTDFARSSVKVAGASTSVNAFDVGIFHKF